MNRLVKERTDQHGQVVVNCPKCNTLMDWSDELELWICSLCRTVGYTKENN